MKFDESSLTAYLVKHLEPLTEADPAILAEYVVALLKKDKPANELHRLCTDNLVEFLGHSAKSFVAELFQALDDNADVTKIPEPLQSTVSTITVQPKSSSQKEDEPSSSSEHRSDSQEKEVSDDDDNDRNHKHRRRDARPNSSDNNVQEQVVRQPSRKRSKPYDNGLFLEYNPQPNDIKKEYNPTSERDASSKFEIQRAGLTPLVGAPPEVGSRTRVSQTIRTDAGPGPQFDLSTTINRPILGRGRGRSTVPWNQNDSRFNPLDSLDFTSQMAPQGPRHPSLFMGTGLSSAAMTQNASWNAFGFIPGMPNRILDPLLPLNLQRTLQPAINPPLNFGMPRQRCRDFEEQGFCMRGDICPMEHGVNRIVIEDVQSLSQFNLPVSLPSSQTLGMQSGTGPLQQVSVPLVFPKNRKAVPSKNGKSGMTVDAFKLNGVSSLSGCGEADVYDPDQPLWNNDCPEASGALLKPPSPPNIDDKSLWDDDASVYESFRMSDGTKSDQQSRSITGNIGSQSAHSSVWGHIASGVKTEKGTKTNTVALGNETNGNHEEAIANPRESYQGKGLVAEEMDPRLTAIKPLPGPRKDFGRNGGRTSKKATRTLFVNGIPHKSNSKEALLSHFQRFGKVIDIYIPVNSEKAFVQFSRREDAEAALKAPDAVMSNRFIKLWWANRDRISDGGPTGSHIKPVQTPGVEVNTISSQLYVANRGKESMPTATQKESSAPAAEKVPPVSTLARDLLVNCPKTIPPVQKKLENLELLKEELRKKQELLAQKRDDFRRQLVKFEKQAILSKQEEVVSEQPVKRHKGDMSPKEVAKAMALKSTITTSVTMAACHEAERALEKSKSGEILVSPGSQITNLDQFSRNINQTSRLPAPLQNRFKLDNRPTSFRILPPLPDDLANFATLKDHFSSFGDLTSVLLEEPETRSNNAGCEASQNCGACVTFTTRHSAEKAYLNGKCWQGHSLQFSWLKVPHNSSNDYGMQRVPARSTPMGASNAEVNAEQVIPGSSLSSAGKSPCSIISEVTAVGSGDPMDVEGTNHAPVCTSKVLLQTSESNHSMTSCEKSAVKFDAAVVEDNTDNGCAQ